MNVQSDIRASVSDEEWQMRVDLAACYRLVDMFGWSDLLGTHISARVPGQEGSPEAGAEGGRGLGDASLRPRHLGGVARQEMVHGLLGRELGDELGD